MYGWMTDIHMNFLLDPGVKRKFLSSISKLEKPLFITGDISDGIKLELNLCELSEASKYPIYFISGNHDYYHSSFERTRKIFERAVSEHENLVYLPMSGVTPLSEDTCVIGTESWYDGRSGNLVLTPFGMNDFRLISDLVCPSRIETIKAFQDRADSALEHLKALLEVAVKKYKKIIILSHPVPFGVLDVKKGELSPFYVWYDAGKYIADFSSEHKEIDFLWLCGHTHASSSFKYDQNLRVYALGAEYGYPKIGAMIDKNLKVKYNG